jgi:hypothetical protein
VSDDAEGGGSVNMCRTAIRAKEPHHTTKAKLDHSTEGKV